MINNDVLIRYGWNISLYELFSEKFGPLLQPARVISAGKGYYTLVTEEASGLAKITGSLEYQTASRSDYPVVGDWVAVEGIDNPSYPYLIHGVVPRKNALSRKSAGSRSEEQVLAANVDTVFIVFSLEGGRKCSPRAAERYVTLVWNSGAQPVILLNKLDICDNPVPHIQKIEEAAPGVDVIPISCRTGSGFDKLKEQVPSGMTIVLTGPSGTGKSTIINTLSGEDIQETGTVRKGDLKGKHTTTRRDLILLPRGALLMDTPGLRELQLWGDTESLDDSFSDILALAEECKFNDCRHTNEPGCAVRKALEEGSLDSARYENYLEMLKELDYLKRRTDARAEQEHIDRWKKIKKEIRRYYKDRGK